MKKIESSKFRSWLKKLKDDTGRARIVARINRLMEGLPGDVALSVIASASCGFTMAQATACISTSRVTRW